jgi:hypothetical protein
MKPCVISNNVPLGHSPDEPRPINEAIGRLDLADYRGRIWATRQRPWVDRLASAWLIRRCIDPQAKLLWLMTPSDCPADALGFDFDGATFTHVGARVTFEVLLASFGLETPALQRFGAWCISWMSAGSAARRRRVSKAPWPVCATPSSTTTNFLH